MCASVVNGALPLVERSIPAAQIADRSLQEVHVKEKRPCLL